jgi:6-phosphogluconolactonase/glucosamine-6-phosphate isomerase/deaminase
MSASSRPFVARTGSIRPARCSTSRCSASVRTVTPRRCFRGTAVLAERSRWVAAVVGAKAEARITLTYPALESSREVAFLVSGAGKREILARVRSGDATLPAAHMRPQGRLHFLVDRTACPPAAT